ncbi:MAG: hypothetical protein FD152_4582 [Xanthobacteraceae bacterium]|nr:MAG: hypothetical protein FD152_4582 [Xanthobacteraceae bacterium]
MGEPPRHVKSRMLASCDPRGGLGQEGAVAALALGFIEALIGLLQQARKRPTRAADRAADADRHADALAGVQIDADRGDLLPNALRNGRRFVLPDAGEKDGKFLAADPTDEITCPRAGGNGLSRQLQRPVAGRMAKAVVDRLEVVEVDDEKDARRLVSAPMQGLEEALAVESAA